METSVFSIFNYLLGEDMNEDQVSAKNEMLFFSALQIYFLAMQ